MTRLSPALLLASLLLCSCASSFNREWQRAVADQKASPSKTITGPWIGTWTSGANGHHGELRCVVSRETGDSHVADQNWHRFHYHATFMKFMSATYDVHHQVKPTKDGFIFSGDQELTGMGGGLYHYEGKGNVNEFHATFRSESDHGVFEMKRP